MEKSVQKHWTTQRATMGKNRKKIKETKKNTTIAREIILQIMTAAVADFFTSECIYLYPAQSGSMIYAFLLDSHMITLIHVLSI